MEIKTSKRNKAKIKMAIQGASGSGKTYSSLLLAQGLSNTDFSKVIVIDTEGGSSNLYAHLGDYNILTLEPPYSPDKYIKAIDTAIEAGMEIVILDSISHCWTYLLNFHSRLKGNSFTNWKVITQKHDEFINKILQTPVHMIATMRSKQAYVLNLKEGKYVPEKIGLKAIQRNDIDFEFTLVFNLDSKNEAMVSKDRTGVISKTNKMKINQAVGLKLFNWSNYDTDDISRIKSEIEACITMNQLKAIHVKHDSLKHELNPFFLIKKEQLLASKI
jgi:hypothetical protein